MTGKKAQSKNLIEIFWWVSPLDKVCDYTKYTAAAKRLIKSYWNQSKVIAKNEIDGALFDQKISSAFLKISQVSLNDIYENKFF